VTDYTATGSPPPDALQTGQIHIANEHGLYSRAERAERPTDIVMTPEQLHRRNLKVALARQSQPRSSLALRTPADVARTVVGTTSSTAPDVLDRIDRIRYIETILSEDTDTYDELKPLFGTALTAAAEDIEVARQELRLMAGTDTDRLAAMRSVTDGLSAVAAADTRALLSGVQTLATQLKERTDSIVSEAALFDRATRRLRETDGKAWTDTYKRIERVAVAGISTLGTPLLDFLTTLSATTEVTVALYLRAGTGPRICDRLDSRVHAGPTTGDPLVPGTQWEIQTPSCQVTELPTTTKHEECRAVAALVDGLLTNGREASDIALVARNADEYERPLSRAMTVYGRHLSVWSQLELKRTLPYRLIATTCSLLDAVAEDTVGAEQLLRPLTVQWTPPRSSIDTPPSPAELSALRRQLDDGEARSATSWLSYIGSQDVSAPVRHVVALLNWCRDQPTHPAPAAAHRALTPLVAAFDRNVLPSLVATDGPDYTDVSRTAHAVERVAGETEGEHLIRETQAKYHDWLEQGHVGRSWGVIGEILDTLATVRPGRREHENAERIDLLDATDTWLRSYPYVIALGLVDGLWPQRTHGAFPTEFRAAVVAGNSEATRRLGVRGAWTEAREYDHFADAVRTASDHLVVTRFREDVQGMSYQRSPLLDTLQPTAVNDEILRRLCSDSDDVPAPLPGATTTGGSTTGEHQ
jgi:ATP-dependent helicase/nuclease subunit B